MQNIKLSTALILSAASFSALPTFAVVIDAHASNAATSGTTQVKVTADKPEPGVPEFKKEKVLFETADRSEELTGNSVQQPVDNGAAETKIDQTVFSEKSKATKTTVSQTSDSTDPESGSDSTASGNSQHKTEKLKGTVSTAAPRTLLDQAIMEVLQSAQQSAEAQKYSTAVTSFSKHKANIRARASDAVNSVFMFKGITTSTEAGNTILDEKLNLSSVGAAKYAKQKFEDEAELKTVTNLLQMASALGNPNSEESQAQIEEAKQELAKIGGAQSAERAYSAMQTFADQSSVNSPPPQWTVSKTQKKIQAGIETAALHDPIVDDIKSDIHHFNKHSRPALIAHSVIRVTLSVTSLAPNVVGPASQALLFGYVVLSGGSEQSKILKELYMEKRLTDRASLLREEMHLAVHNYELGTLTKNPALTECSRLLVTRMTDAKTAETLLTTNDVPQVIKPVDPLAAESEKVMASAAEKKSSDAQLQVSERTESPLDESAAGSPQHAF